MLHLNFTMRTVLQKRAHRSVRNVPRCRDRTQAVISQNRVRIAHSCAVDARAAVRELHAGIQQSETELVIFFCSSLYDLDVVADEVNRLFADVPVVGCTTAGASPVVVAIDGTDYVRSIQKANPDGSLTVYCAIDEGLVLRVVRGVDLLGNLERAFDNLRASVGPLEMVIACDCMLRKLEMTQSGLKESVGRVLHRNNIVGFSTYGEQFRSVHVNQTLTGIAFGCPRDG